MSQLPLELLLAIVELIVAEDTAAALEIRLVSKTFNALVAPLAFRVLSVRDSVQSAEGLACMQAGDTATINAVQEIVFRGNPEDSDSYDENAEYEDADEDANDEDADDEEADSLGDEDVSGKEGRDALFAAFSGLTKFCNLKILRFEFHSKFRELGTSDNPSHFLLLQTGLFAVLAAHPPPSLTSLALHNLIAIPHNIYATDAFQNIFRPLTALDVTVIADGGRGYGFDTVNDRGYNDPQLCDFWETSIPSILKNATNLISLALGSNYPQVGVRPSLPLAGIHLPLLTNLSLDYFVLDPARADYDIVEFIVRHKATLTHLKFVDCYVYGVEPGVYPRPWRAVLQRFQQELPGLRSFQLLASMSGWTFLERFGYLFDTPPYYHVDHQTIRDAQHLDEPALEALVSAVESRPIF
ncbi:hypothetical protein K438DRAFT_924304 [Mycena galopus ATCC 62051]|nr:hypothetical protein K438DRAFT_924304 [Mycena galopus ATCC 62051]